MLKAVTVSSDAVRARERITPISTRRERLWVRSVQSPCILIRIERRRQPCLIFKSTDSFVKSRPRRSRDTRTCTLPWSGKSAQLRLSILLFSTLAVILLHEPSISPLVSTEAVRLAKTLTKPISVDRSAVQPTPPSWQRKKNAF